MGKPDIAVKNWLSHKERFADFFNGTIFEGRQVVLPEELVMMNSESDFIVQDKSDKRKSKGVQRYRDIVMRWKGSIMLMIMACEVQDKVHYAMPVKNMLYDSLSYITQMRELWDSLSEEERKESSQEEFFSRFRKNDKLYPVITLVFYYGTKDWDGSIELFDMFEWSDKTDIALLKQFVPNYRINLVEPAKLDDLSAYKTDLQMIFGVLKCRKDKDKLLDYIESNRPYFNALDLETAQAMAEMLHSDKVIKMIENESMEDYDMCKALEDLYNDGIAKGKVEDIIDLLSDYGDISEELKNRIFAETDLDVLKRWHKLSARVSSIEEFEQSMNQA